MTTAGTFQQTVQQLMTADPVVILPATTLAEVAEILDAFEISGLPVVDDGGRLLGVVSETDLTRLRGSGLPRSTWHGVTARDVMGRPAVTVRAADSLTEAARVMSMRHIHRLVVVDEVGAPIGVISESDLIRDIADDCDLD